jgi:quercetin dioxygenase-like cupin family protein
MKIKFLFYCLFAAVCIFFISISAFAQETTSSGRNVAEMKLTTIPGLPTCVTGSVQSGNPTNAAAIIFAKIPAGCSIPWHWHTPNEHVMIVSGIARVEMKDAKALVLHSGGFALLPSHHVHQFHCQEACSIYIYSDVAFDIHYVNAQGNEITPDEALKAVKEKVATEMK